MHGGGNDMVGRFAIELLDIFTEVRLDALDPIFFEEVIQLDLFGDHAFALDDRAAGLFLADRVDLLECLCGRFPPR